MLQCGQVLSDITPAGMNAIFERFRGILQDGSVSKRCQCTIEKLFKVRKSKFKEFPGVIEELDLVEEGDRIVHEISLDDEDIASQEQLQDKTNLFSYDAEYTKNEQEWQEIRKEILGESANLIEQQRAHKETQEDVFQPVAVEPESVSASFRSNFKSQVQPIQDMTEKDLVNLRRSIYLVVMSSVDFQECCHKLLKMNLREG